MDIALPDKTYKVAGVGEGLDEGSHHLGHLRRVHDGVSAENIMKLIFLAANASEKKLDGSSAPGKFFKVSLIFEGKA